MGAGVLIPALLGGLGLYQNERARADQRGDMNSALDLERAKFDMMEPAMRGQVDAFRKLLGLADEYDPERDAQRNIGAIRKQAEGAVSGALSNYRATSGMTPGQSSEFNINAADVASKSMAPFVSAMNRTAGAGAEKKMDAYRSLLGAPLGGMGASFDSLANAHQQRGASRAPGDSGGLLAMIADAIDQMGQKKTSIPSWAGKARWRI